MNRLTCAWLAAVAAASCSTTPQVDADATHPFSWVLGDWVGYREDGATGARTPLVSRVTHILGGSSIAEDLAVGDGGGPTAATTSIDPAPWPASGRCTTWPSGVRPPRTEAR